MSDSVTADLTIFAIQDRQEQQRASYGRSVTQISRWGMNEGAACRPLPAKPPGISRQRRAAPSRTLVPTFDKVGSRLRKSFVMRALRIFEGCSAFVVRTSVTGRRGFSCYSGRSSGFPPAMKRSISSGWKRCHPLVATRPAEAH